MSKRPLIPPLTDAYFQGHAHVSSTRNLLLFLNEARVSSRTVTSDAEVTATDTIILVNASANPVVITLLPPAIALNKLIWVKRLDASVNAVTLAGVVDDVSNRTLDAQYESLTLHCDGTAYWIM